MQVMRQCDRSPRCVHSKIYQVQFVSHLQLIAPGLKDKKHASCKDSPADQVMKPIFSLISSTDNAASSYSSMFMVDSA
jgi:hypothetical protein